jgi:hypothetical protein
MFLLITILEDYKNSHATWGLKYTCIPASNEVADLARGCASMFASHHSWITVSDEKLSFFTIICSIIIQFFPLISLPSIFLIASRQSVARIRRRICRSSTRKVLQSMPIPPKPLGQISHWKPWLMLLGTDPYNHDNYLETKGVFTIFFP